MLVVSIAFLGRISILGLDLNLPFVEIVVIIHFLLFYYHQLLVVLYTLSFSIQLLYLLIKHLQFTHFICSRHFAVYPIDLFVYALQLHVQFVILQLQVDILYIDIIHFITQINYISILYYILT